MCTLTRLLATCSVMSRWCPSLPTRQQHGVSSVRYTWQSKFTATDLVNFLTDFSVKLIKQIHQFVSLSCLHCLIASFPIHVILQRTVASLTQQIQQMTAVNKPTLPRAMIRLLLCNYRVFTLRNVYYRKGFSNTALYVSIHHDSSLQISAFEHFISSSGLI